MNTKNLLELLDEVTITPDKIEKFLDKVLKVIQKSKDDLEELSEEKLAKIQEGLDAIEEKHSSLLDEMDEMVGSVSEDFYSKIEEANKILKQLKSIKMKDGKDGSNGRDGLDAVVDYDFILSQIKLPEYKDVILDEGETIVQKINDLSTDDEELKIDASHIKNLPEIVSKEVRISGSRLLDGIQDVDLSNLTRDANGRYVLGSPSTGGISDGDKGDITVSGGGLTWTIDSGLSALKIADGSVSDAEFQYLNGVTSGIQAQLNSKGVGTWTDSSTNVGTNKTLIDKTNVVEEVTTTASSATPTPTGGSLRNFFTITALATAPTFAVPSGTPQDGNYLTIRIKDNGTARALAFNAIYRFSTDVVAPTTTTLSKTMYIGFRYNGADSKWDCLSINNGF